MPGRNGTGPAGNGPITGRGLGNCKSDENVMTENQALYNGFYCYKHGFGVGNGQGFGNGQGLGLGRGNGCRRGNKRGFGNNNSYLDEKSFLNQQEAFLEDQLKQVKSRINDINTATD